MNFRVASEQERTITYQNNWTEWGGQETVQNHIEKEQKFYSQLSNMDVYILVENEKILAQCEIFRLDAWINDVPVKCAGLASVFIPEECRGKGYCRKMFEFIKNELKTKAIDYCVLYSSIGSEIYHSFGWNPERVYSLSFVPKLVETGEETFIDLKRAFELFKLYDNSKKSKLAPNELLILDSAEMIQWNYVRSTHFAGKHVLSGYEINESNFILWTVKSGNIGTITCIMYSDNSMLKQLIDGASFYFAKIGCKKLEFWTNEKEIIRALEMLEYKLELSEVCIPAIYAVKPVKWKYVEARCWV